MQRSLIKTATLFALFFGALLATRRDCGSSPIAWIDTFRDEEEVQRCLTSNSCTLTGVSTSIPGQAHAVAWLELRTLLAWFGVGLDSAHFVLQLLNAVAVVLVFHLATQLGGRLAGAAAVWILVASIGALTIRLTALYNQQCLLFLGAVFTLACTAVVERPGPAAVTLAALVGAVMANVHLACVLTGISVVWVALLAPRRRLLLAAFGALLFVLATVAMAPPTWLHNLSSLLQHRLAVGGAAGELTLPRNVLVFWALFAIAAWVASFLSSVWKLTTPGDHRERAREITVAARRYRRRIQGALAVIIPFLVAFFVAPLFGLKADAKYLVHLKAACAVAAAVPLALAAGPLLGPVFSPRLLRVVDGIIPFALALFVAARPSPTADEERTVTIDDLAAVAHILHDEHGWDVRRMLENVKAPDSMAALTGLSQLSNASSGPGADLADIGSSAVLVVLETDELPHPLPATWKIVRRSGRAATVLVLMQSRIDWSAFQICAGGADGGEARCVESGWRLEEAAGARGHVPLPELPSAGMVELKLPLRAATSGFTSEMFMPRMPGVCGGYIASRPSEILQVDPDRRHATLSVPASGQASPSTVELEWHVGSTECDAWAYDGLPFVIEGDPATVRRLEAILRKREG